MRGYIVNGDMPVSEQPLDNNEVAQTIIASRAFVAAMIMGGRVMALAKTEPEYPMPRPLPDDFYEKGEQ